MEERRRYIYAFCMLSTMNHLPEDKKVAGSQSETATYFKKGRIIAVGTSIDEEKVVIKDREITGISDPDSNGNVTITVDGDPFTTEVGYVIYHVGQKTGGCDDLGNASGSKDADDPTVPVSYRGIEDPWGNVWEFVDGMNILDEDRRTYITDDPKNFADNVFDGQYKAIGIPLPTDEAYWRNFAYSDDADWLLVPSETGGEGTGPNTYIPDYFYEKWGGWTDEKVALVGGTWDVGDLAGMFRLFSCSSSFASDRFVGARLLHIPQ